MCVVKCWLGLRWWRVSGSVLTTTHSRGVVDSAISHKPYVHPLTRTWSAPCFDTGPPRRRLGETGGRKRGRRSTVRHHRRRCPRVSGVPRAGRALQSLDWPHLPCRTRRLSPGEPSDNRGGVRGRPGPGRGTARLRGCSWRPGRACWETTPIHHLPVACWLPPLPSGHRLPTACGQSDSPRR